MNYRMFHVRGLVIYQSERKKKISEIHLYKLNLSVITRNTELNDPWLWEIVLNVFLSVESMVD